MENNAENDWTQQSGNEKEIREGKSSLDKGNESNEKREHGDWSNGVKRGNGDYGAEGGRSDEGVTGGETDISRPYGSEPDLKQKQEENDQWNVQHPGELPV